MHNSKWVPGGSQVGFNGGLAGFVLGVSMRAAAALWTIKCMLSWFSQNIF